MDQFKTAVAESEGLKTENIAAFAGSSYLLHRITLAFTSPTRSLVMADPGYEASSRAANFIGAKVYRVPLRTDYSHDVKAMVAADPNAGLFYICNPNNPSGTVTSKEDIEWLIENKPKGSILLREHTRLTFTSQQPRWVHRGWRRGKTLSFRTDVFEGLWNGGTPHGKMAFAYHRIYW